VLVSSFTRCTCHLPFPPHPTSLPRCRDAAMPMPMPMPMRILYPLQSTSATALVRLMLPHRAGPRRAPSALRLSSRPCPRRPYTLCTVQKTFRHLPLGIALAKAAVLRASPSRPAGKVVIYTTLIVIQAFAPGGLPPGVVRCWNASIDAGRKVGRAYSPREFEHSPQITSVTFLHQNYLAVFTTGRLWCISACLVCSESAFA
jgi:hypothetical protein